MRTRGLALIIVIGILGVLAALAVAFVAMAQLERRASEQRVNAARAYLLARSGIEDALARLELGQDPVYGGEDWMGDGDQGSGSFDRQQEVYRPGVLNVEDCPVRHALRPSFFAKDGFAPPRPDLVPVDTKQRGYSGRLSGDYASKGNTYAVKAGAEGSEGRGFYINGGDPSVHSDPTMTSDYNTNLRRMMGILARAITEDVAGAAGGLSSGSGVEDVQGVAGGLLLTEADGWALIDQRPSTGWKDREQVKKLALGGSQAKLAALKPYFILHAWTDKKVIAPHVVVSILDPNGTWYNPVTNQSEPAKAYRSWGEYKLDPARRDTKPALRAADFERINLKVVGRAPVDLSWARTKRPALVALLGGLKGIYIDEAYATPIRHGDVLGRLNVSEVTLAWDTTDICNKVTTWIQTSTSEFNTWQQWHDFCTALPDAVVMSTQDYATFLACSAASSTSLANNATVTDYYDKYVLPQAGLPPLAFAAQARSLWLKGQAVRDILKANFNPNSNLNKFSPNLSTWKLVDKGDLLVHSAEFSLLPVSMGHQEVSSVGRVLDRRGRMLTSRVLKVLLAAPPSLRLTTQKEFIAENLGTLGGAGDETESRLPGQAGPFITSSRGNVKTWGHALSGLGIQGASLQTYPEPVVNDGDWPSINLSVNPADYDGSVQSATVETAKDAFYSASGPQDPSTGMPYRKMTLLARYTGHFDLDQSAADPNGTGPQIAPLFITPRQNHPDFHQVTSHCTGEPGKQVPLAASNNFSGYQSSRQIDLGSPKLEELRYSLLRAGDPAAGDCKLNTLYPDGCYSELNRVPEYLDRGNADGFHGVMSFWIKSNRLPPVNDYLGYSRGHPILKWTNFVDAEHSSGNYNQFFCWGDSACATANVSSKDPLACCFELGHQASDARMEHCFGVGRHLIPHRWELLTLRWDFRVFLANSTMEMLLNSGRAGAIPAERGAQDNYIGVGSFADNDPSAAEDITVDDLSVWDGSQWIKGPHRLPLGGRGHPELEFEELTDYFGASADATFDEFALYDFGEGGTNQRDVSADYALTTKASAEVLAAVRFAEGRYYKESAYFGLGDSRNTAAEWFSAPIFLGGPVRIRGLAWTQIVPPELRFPGDLLPDGGISFELVNVDGTEYVLPDRPGLLPALDGLLGTAPQLLTNPAFTPVNRSLRGAFRLHAVFQPNLADPINTPILDPLTLDDITVYYEPFGGPRVTAWETNPQE